jgi:hypothetical protein
VYDPGRPDIDEVAKKALVDLYDENSLDPTVYPSLLRFENQVVGHGAGPPEGRRAGGGQLHQRGYGELHDGGEAGP